MIMLKKIGAWLLYSSKDSTKWSLTVKSVLAAGFTGLSVLIGLTHLHVPGPEIVSQFIDAFVAFLQTVAACISSATFVWGIGRKLWKTIFDTNDVVENHPAFQ